MNKRYNMLLIAFFLLLSSQVQGLQRRDNSTDHMASLNSRALRKLTEISGKLASLDLKNVRDIHEEAGAKTARDIEQIGKAAKDLVGSLSVNRRDVQQKVMFGSQREQLEEVFKKVADVSATAKRNLKDGLSLRSDIGVKQLRNTAEKLSIPGRDLMQSLRSQSVGLMNINQRDKTQKHLEGLASFDVPNWLALRQDSQQKSLRDVQEKDQRSMKLADLSSVFDWFPWKQDLQQKSLRNVQEKGQRSMKLADLSSVFDWFPWKQDLQQKSLRDVKEKGQRSMKLADLSSMFDWFPWKQEIHESNRAVKQELPAGISADLLLANGGRQQENGMSNEEKSVNERDKEGKNSLFGEPEIARDWKTGMLSPERKQLSLRGLATENQGTKLSTNENEKQRRYSVTKVGDCYYVCDDVCDPYCHASCELICEDK